MKISCNKLLAIYDEEMTNLKQESYRKLKEICEREVALIKESIIKGVDPKGNVYALLSEK